MTVKKRTTFLADKISGCEGASFTLSALPPVVVAGNRLVKYKFPFWGFSVPRESDYGTEWIDNTGYEREAARILKAVTTGDGLSYFRFLKDRIIREENKFEKLARQLMPKIGGFSERELATNYEKMVKAYFRAYGSGIVTFLYEAILSEKLMQSLAARHHGAAAQLPRLLKSPYRSFMLKSEQDLGLIKKARSRRQRERLAKAYADKYFYIRTNYLQAPLVTSEYINERLKHHIDSKAKVAATVGLKLLPWERAVVSLLKITEVIRDKRKQSCVIGTYLMFRFLEEAAKRKKISPQIAARAYWYEYKDLLTDGRLPARLAKRQEFSTVYSEKNCYYLDYLALREKPIKHSTTDLMGTPASGGRYQGRVRLIFQRKDFHTFKKGEILVTQMTRPEFLPVMKKAAAIVTDEGGLTCHAAIVAREMGIPCIVGVKNASRVLRSGQIIEVDADRGMVKIKR